MQVMAAQSIDISSATSYGVTLGNYIRAYAGNEAPEIIVQPPFQSQFIQNHHQGVQFTRIRKQFPGNPTEFWLAFTLQNPSDAPIRIILDGNRFPYKQTVLYQDFKKIDQMVLGERVGQRFFEVTVAAKSSSEILLHATPALSWTLNLIIWPDLNEFYRHYFQSQIIFISTAIVIGMSFLFNAMAVIAYRSRAFTYYSLYLLFYGFWNFTAWKLAAAPFGTFDGVAFSASLMGCFAMLFSVHFLKLQRYRILYRLCSLYTITAFICAAASIYDSLLGIRMIQIASLFGSPFGLFCGLIVSIRNRERHAYLYCLAYGAMLVGVVCLILYNYGFLENPMFFYAMNIGILIETLLMMWAIGEHIWAAERERKHSYQQLAKVFFPHQLHQMKHGQSLESTMPVGEQEACILAFDVIASSKVQHPAFVDRWEEFMAACRTLMMEGYQGKPLRSQAYLIKEMGDGFLCSIGFPFAAIGPSMCEDAVRLALRLRETFLRTMREITQHEPVHCAIGVAKGPARAYFSKSGAIRHDLWGKGLIWATRYERLRDPLFRILDLEPSSMIIIDQRVFSELSPVSRREFTVLNLGDIGLSVRDDPEATQIAYHYFASESQDISENKQQAN